MENPTLVYVDLAGVNRLVGRFWSSAQRGGVEYCRSWLTEKNRYSLEPAFRLSATGDSAPDRWGRSLMRRAAASNNTLREIDCLLMVDDETRQGALRFARQEGGPYLADDEAKKIPPLIELPKLLRAADRVSGDKDTEDDLRLLLAPGSSLGGARPRRAVGDREVSKSQR